MRLKRYLRQRLRDFSALPIAYKLALAITVLILTVMGALSLVVTDRQSALMRDQANAYGQTIVNQLAETAKEPILAEDDLALRIITQSLGQNPDLQGATLYAENGQALSATGIQPAGDIAALYARARRLREHNYSFDWHWVDASGQRQDSVSFLTPVKFQQVVVGHALVTFSRGIMVQSTRQAKRAVLVATLSLSLLTILLAFIMSKRLSRPIYDLMHASKAIGEGDYHYRIEHRRRDELGTLIESFNDMAHNLLQKVQVEGALSRYVSPNVAREILNNLDQVELGGRHVNATVLFADIVGFTQLAENMAPKDVAELLNQYFSYITQAATLYNGNVDKFIGDCAMVVFGAPDKDAEHRFNAIACAVLIRRLSARLNERREAAGTPPVMFRIGLNTGDMLAGNMGSHERMQYTVVGDAVNLAARLSGVAGPGEIVIRDEHYLDPEVQRRVIARKDQCLRVRGKTEPITVYQVKDVATTYRLAMDQQIDDLLGAPLP